MANPIKFPEANHIFGKPKDMTDEQCSSLHTFVGTSSDNFPLIISKWQLSEKEIEILNTTGCIYLTVIGKNQPPISITSEYPFNQTQIVA